jgi:N6-adenosine-specific RNA methylase IME4
MTIDQIANLNVNKIAASDAVLFLWVTFPKLKEIFDNKIIEKWGFEYKTVAFNWFKKNKIKNSFFWGMGFWSRSNSEICLLATRGHPKRQSASVHQVIGELGDFEWIDTEPILSRIEGHSKKPDIVRKKIVELCGDLPRIELFAREKVDGWDAWGDEVESDIQLLFMENKK